MQETIFGETKLTGSVRQQLEQVQMGEGVDNAKELLHKWAEFQLGINPATVDMIIVADRVSRNILNAN